MINMINVIIGIETLVVNELFWARFNNIRFSVYPIMVQFCQKCISVFIILCRKNIRHENMGEV